jgi:hypothetical protein
LILFGYQIEFDLYEFHVKFRKKEYQKADVTKSLFLGTTLYEINQESKIKKIRIILLWFFDAFFKISQKTIGVRIFLLKGSFQDNPERYFTISNEGNLKKISITSNIKYEGL